MKSSHLSSLLEKVSILLPQSPTKSVADMKQLTEGQRYKMEAYLQAGMKKDEIARLLGIHRSTLIVSYVVINGSRRTNTMLIMHSIVMNLGNRNVSDIQSLQFCSSKSEYNA